MFRSLLTLGLTLGIVSSASAATDFLGSDQPWKFRYKTELQSPENFFRCGFGGSTWNVYFPQGHFIVITIRGDIHLSAKQAVDKINSPLEEAKHGGSYCVLNMPAEMQYKIVPGGYTDIEQAFLG